MNCGLIHALPTFQRRCFNRKEAASYLCVSPTTFDKLVNDGTAPNPITLRGRKVWDVRALDQMLDAASGMTNVGSTDARDVDDILDRELAAFGEKHGFH